MEKVSFQTEDSVTIVGTWNDCPAPRAVALLLHMMPATKESFAALQAKLAGSRIASLAIDLRGHGESVECDQEARVDYHDFDDSGHQASRMDVLAAARWIEERMHLAGEKLALIGASIGANLALQYAAEHPTVPAVVALSPGLVYRGVATKPSVTAMAKGQRLLLIASQDDGYSYDTVLKLAEASLAKTEVIRLTDGGHGTAMFEANPDLFDRIVEWIAGAFVS